MNKAAFRQISYGLYIVTAGEAGKFNGQIANAVFQVTSEPPTIAISINKQNYTHDLIKQSRKFAMSILTEAAPMTFIGTFGFKCGRDIDKLQNVRTKLGTTGVPIVLDYSCAYLEAEIISELECGTHTIFVGKIVDADILNQDEPMTYAYYHKVKGGKSPKNAPTYLKEEPAAAKAAPSEKYVCKVCGYVYDEAKGDPDNKIAAGTKFADLPDDWTCPVCGAPKSDFEKEK